MSITGYGFDVNQIGASDYARTATRQLITQKTGLVVDIVVNNRHEEYIQSNGKNFGYAKIKILPQDEGSDNSALNWIPPRDIHIQQLPIIGEQVVVEYIGGGLMYSRAINKENQVGSNISVITNAVFSSDPNKQTTTETDSNLALSGIRINNSGLPTKTSGYIPTIQPVAPEEGDLIIQGRYGNVIRLGSSKFIDSNAYPLPNILLSVGQPFEQASISTTERTPQSLVYEDTITNASTIWMVTDQLIPFEPATLNSIASNKANLRDSEIERDKYYYRGAQIFVNSDRVVINSKQSEIQLFSKTEINLSAAKSITMASERSLLLSSNLDIKLKSMSDVFVRANNISLLSTKSISSNTQGNYTILGKNIFIGSGEDTSQPMVLGGQLSVYLKELLRALQLLPAIFLPQPAPSAATAATQMQLTFAKLLADANLKQAASFNSVSNFTAKENKV